MKQHFKQLVKQHFKLIIENILAKKNILNYKSTHVLKQNFKYLNSLC